MKLTVIGCAGSYPSPASAASCYLVSDGSTSLVLDLGNGALGALLAHIDLDDVSAVFISHLHADHCVDLVALYVALKYAPARRQARLPVYGPAALPRRIAAAYSGDPETDMSDVFDFKAIAPQRPVHIGGATVLAWQVAHPGESFGFRISMADKVLAYSGDSDECEALVALARDAHLALFEASFLEPVPATPPLPPGLHMTGAMAGRCARRASAKSLLLTHTVYWNQRDGGHGSELAAAVEQYTGPVNVAAPGMVVQL